VRLLLDTPALVWWLLGDERLSPAAREAIAGAREVYVSAASAWELSTKARLGKWADAQSLATDLGSWVRQQGMTALDQSLDHGARAGGLPGPHRDPFDRMLIAQCQAEDLTLVSGDAVFDHYGVRRIW
jgi:PIN domain nuclease of toxin-antitoxin system